MSWSRYLWEVKTLAQCDPASWERCSWAVANIKRKRSRSQILPRAANSVLFSGLVALWNEGKPFPDLGDSKFVRREIIRHTFSGVPGAPSLPSGTLPSSDKPAEHFGQSSSLFLESSLRLWWEDWNGKDPSKAAAVTLRRRGEWEVNWFRRYLAGQSYWGHQAKKIWGWLKSLQLISMSFPKHICCRQVAACHVLSLLQMLLSGCMPFVSITRKGVDKEWAKYSSHFQPSAASHRLKCIHLKAKLGSTVTFILHAHSPI